MKSTNFFLADVQTGLGPFLAASLAGSGWQPGRIGIALTVGGIVTVLLQTPAGAIVDRLHSKRMILIMAALVLPGGAILLWVSVAPIAVYTAEVLIGSSGPFLAPTLAAVTMGLIGARLFDRQFGKNQSFKAAGNIASVLLIALVSHLFGGRAMFLTAAVLTSPPSCRYCQSGAKTLTLTWHAAKVRVMTRWMEKDDFFITTLRGGRVLFTFLACAFLFHLGNAAMPPQLGEMRTRGESKSAAPFMSACIIVTQAVIMCSALFVGRYANLHDASHSFFLVSQCFLFVRCSIPSFTTRLGLSSFRSSMGSPIPSLALCPFLVVADRARGTGHFNLVQGMLATAVGLGAALSTTLGGMLIQHGSYRISFLTLGGTALAAFFLVFFRSARNKFER